MRMQGMDDDGAWDLRQARRNALGGSNVPVTLDGTGSGELWKPPISTTAPTLPHPGMMTPVGGGMGMGAYSNEGMVGGPITPGMVMRPKYGRQGW